MASCRTSPEVMAMDARRVRRIVWIGLATVLMLGAAGMTWRCRRDRARSGAITASPIAAVPAPSPAGPGMAASEGAPPSAAAAATAQAEGPPTIQIPPERQQQIGVKFAAAQLVPAHVEIRAAGKVAPDETRIAHIHTKVSGWIDDVFVNFVGQPVRKGQPLFTLYSPDLVASQEEYLLALL